MTKCDVDSYSIDLSERKRFFTDEIPDEVLDLWGRILQEQEEKCFFPSLETQPADIKKMSAQAFFHFIQSLHNQRISFLLRIHLIEEFRDRAMDR